MVSSGPGPGPGGVTWSSGPGPVGGISGSSSGYLHDKQITLHHHTWFLQVGSLLENMCFKFR